MEEEKSFMQNLRAAVGVALASSLLVIFVSGFVVRSTREVVLILCGYAAGLAAVYLLERLKAYHAR